MLAPNQTLLLHDYFTRSRDLWLLCEQYDCDHDQMLQIIGAITPYLPGKGLDYNAILSNDPIACDHLVLHCQRSIGQLDALYDRLISLFDSSSTRDLQINKRTTVNIPPDWAKPSFSDGQLHWDTSNGSEKIETTTLENQQRFRILESAMKCLECGLKMQITLTQRKEKLSKEQLSKENFRNHKPCAKQEAQPPQNQAKDNTPFTGLSGCTAMQAYKGMTGYELNQLQSESTSSDHTAPSAPPRETWQSESSSPLAPREASRATGLAPNSPEAKSGAPGWLYPTTGAAQPQEALSKSILTDNTMSQEELPGEEEPVTPEFFALSASPRETNPPADPFANFGPPKEFAYPPHIAELMPNRYPWRKELKEKQAARKTTLLPISASYAPPRETPLTSANCEEPAYHQRE